MGISAEVFRQVAAMIRPLRVRVANLMVRGIVKLVDDGKMVQSLQFTGLNIGDEAGNPEVIPGGEHLQPYGFLSVPQAGAEVLALFPDGDRGHPIVVAVADRRYRPTGGQDGEVGLYTDEGDQIRLGRGHIVSVSTTGEIRLGSAAASTAVALASELADLKAKIAAWSPVSGDGGASLKTVIAGWLAPGATKVKAE